MRKRIFSFALAFIMLFNFITNLNVKADEITKSESEIHSLVAPNKDLKMDFWVNENGVPFYNLYFNGEAIIKDSSLGIKTTIGDFKEDLSIVNTETSSGNESWSPVVGEKEVIVDNYNELTINLKHTNETEFSIIMRVYDTGAALRYKLPVSDSEYTITDEYTQFVFPESANANVHEKNNQTIPKRISVKNFNSGTFYQRPMTIEYASGSMMTIAEANLDNYGVMILRKDSAACTLKSAYASYKSKGPNVKVDANGPSFTPWRSFVVGDSQTDLANNSSIIQNLNEAPDEETYNFSEWVKPGTALRADSGMNTEAIKDIVDQAEAREMKYVLLDTGWYGPEYDVNCDPRLDPSLLDPNNKSDKILLDKYFGKDGEGKYGTGEGIFNTRGVGFNKYGSLGEAGTFQTNVDIPTICDYANERGVGILLYVNGVYLPDSSKRDRFDVDELFAKFSKWGVKGVKPGFVNVRAQDYEEYMQEVIETAAKYQLVMTVHDEYVITGVERTFPNLLTTEGILGDEGIGKGQYGPQIEEDIATLFTRTIQGPADHTYCYPGKGTKVYALASPILFKSGLHLLYWYTNPSSVPEQDKDKMDIWIDLPATWADTKYLEASMYEYATYARKSFDDEWYLGSLSAIDRDLEIPLTFLDNEVKYVADIYADGADADPLHGLSSANDKKGQELENYKAIVDSNTILKRVLKYGHGYAVKFTKATAEEIETLPEYNSEIEILKGRVAEGKKINGKDYSVESFEALTEALKEGEAILNSPNDYTDEEVYEVSAKIENALNNLVSIKIIEEIINNAERLSAHHYTKESWNVLSEAILKAKELFETTATQSQIDDAVKNINDAISNLKKLNHLEIKETVYLSDIDYTEESWSVSKGQTTAIKKDANRANTKISLMINGSRTYFDKGMGLDAPGELYYDISDLGYEVFEGYVGVDAEKPTQGSIIFRVYGDGKLLYESKASGTGSQEAQKFSIPIANVDKLFLESDMNGNKDGDWSDWADAKFLVMRNNEAPIVGLTIDGEDFKEFNPKVTDYYYGLDENTEEVPTVTAILDDNSIEHKIVEATSIPGTTEISAVNTNGETITYRVHFRRIKVGSYLSDLDYESFTTHNNVFKDVAYDKLSMSVTDKDGKSKLTFDKGVGLHAKVGTDSSVVYDIEGLGFNLFETYVGISYDKNDSRSAVQFRIFADDEEKPRYESGVMKTRTPAEFVSIDVKDVKKLKIVVDALGDMSADHSNLADAKFLKYETIDKSQLIELYESLKDKENENYTPLTWELFTLALADAKSVIDFEFATINDVEIAIENLNNAVEGLIVTSDKYALQFAVEIANEVSEEELSQLVPAVVEEFKAALEEARNILADENATQEEVNNSFDRLSEVMQMLSFKKGDKEQLQKLLDKIASLDSNQYIGTNWSELEAIVLEANNIIQDENALEKDVEECYDKLMRKFLSLRLKPSKDKLQDLINNARSLSREMYTTESFAILEASLEDAEAVFKNENATVAEIATAEKSLVKAINSLEKSEVADNNTGDLPKTGGTSAVLVTLVAVVIIGAGVFLVKKRASKK